ncbi:protein rep [Schinkia azotoformans]|uniref:protein rep n=1 Tax=Schinkia azotoformans TaxID=1454 RepID=UPI002DBA3B59|nr:protein rep [Schinkia azotoformans]MEC1746786.1 protein rep [Schinkia azotoformans]
MKLLDNLTGEVLLDKTKSGRERPWKLHKTNSQLLSEAFERLGKQNKAEKVCNCGSSLKFNVCPQGHEKKLTWANFCRVRLCPMCSWRRSLLVAYQLKQVAHEAVKRQPLRWLFLTLTVRNCSGDDLDKTINLMMKAFHKLSRRKQFNDSVVGWFRAFEITRNMFEDSYHPHFHVLIGVQPSYFRNKDKYLKHDDWVKLWQESLQIDYKPVVDIRIVKQKRNIDKEVQILEEKGIHIEADGSFVDSQLSGSAVAELAKYSTKSEDYIVYNRYRQKQKGKDVQLLPDPRYGIDENKTDEVVSVLDATLSRRRLLAYGGLLKEVWNELQLDDVEEESADLIHADDNSSCPCSVCGSNMLEELYTWIPGVKNYVKKEKE